MHECILVLVGAVRSSLGTSQTRARAQSPRDDIVDTLDPSTPHASPD